MLIVKCLKNEKRKKKIKKKKTSCQKKHRKRKISKNLILYVTF